MQYFTKQNSYTCSQHCNNQIGQRYKLNGTISACIWAIGCSTIVTTIANKETVSSRHIVYHAIAAAVNAYIGITI